MLKQWIDSTMDQQLEDLSGLLRIPSVSRGIPEQGKPLGRDVYRALEYIVALAKKLGFENSRILDGYCATVDYGEGDEMLMIMTHLDVVPAGEGWDSEPFDPVVRNGRLYARGVVDDKGAAVSSLYALAAVKEAGLKMKRRVRLLFGADEEVDWACIDRYKQTEELPAMAFTPDGSYPVVNSEMNILHTVYELPLHGSTVKIACGSAANVVPGTAEAHLSVPVVSCDVPYGFSAEFGDSCVRIQGVGGHAAMNDLAKNALQCLLSVLAVQDIPPQDQILASGLSALLGYDLHGEGFGLDVQDESGHLTLSPDILNWDENSVSITLDCRYPFSLTETDVLQKLDSSLSVFGFKRISSKNSPGHYIPADSELVSSLLKVYEKHTGKKVSPVTMGGGTYARGFENAVAFGVESESGPAQCHIPNESCTLEEILFNTNVFADAIALLAAEQNI